MTDENAVTGTVPESTDAAFNGIQVREFVDKTQAVEALGKLSQANSSLIKVINEISTETNLAVAPKDDGVLAWLKGFVMSKAVPRDTIVEAAFAPLHKFATSQSLENYRIKLGEVQEKLRAAPSNSWEELQKAQNKDWEKPAGDIISFLSSLEAGSGSKAAANFLKSPLAHLSKKGKEAEANNLEEAWKNLVRKARQLEGRYPFSNSPTDVQLNEFVQFYNPADGELSKLHKGFLSDKVEGEPGQLKSKNTVEFNEAAVAYLNQAFKLQQAFFPAGQQPKISYALSVTPPPNKKVELKVDGTNATAEGSGSMYQLAWPSSGVEAGIKVIVSDKAQAQAVGQTTPPTGGEAANYPGLWGVFRMTAGGKIQFTWSGATAKLTPPTNNPFAINFSGLRAPENFK